MDAAELVVRITGDIKDVSRSMDRIARDTSTMADRLENSAERGFGALERWAKRGALAAGVAITAIAVGVAQVGTAYEDALNTFEVVSSATEQQMAAVGKKAKELGNDLTLPATSAADAAEAMTELAKAGLSVEESMDAAKGVLQLAAAAGVEEGQAAEYAASALNAFGLEGREAARVADLLAGASVAAMGEITDMGDALKMSAAVFNLAGFTVEDLTTAISMMAQAGIKGSDAGTSLKQSVLQLINPSKKAGTLIRHLGIEVYDAEGSMKPFRSVIDEVSRATSHMSEEQRNAALGTIFGADAIRAAAVVYTQGTDSFDKMAAAVTRQGVAAEVAAAKTKGLRGAWEAIQSTLETGALTLYAFVAPPVTEFLRGIGVGLNMLADDPGWQRLTGAIKPFAEGFLGTLDRIGKAMQEGGFRAGFAELRTTIQDSLAGIDWNYTLGRMMEGLEGARGRVMEIGTWLMGVLLEFLQTVDWASVSEQLTAGLVGMVTAVDWAKFTETAVALLFVVAPQIIDGFIRGIIKAATENPLDFVMLLVALGFMPLKVLGALGAVLTKIPIFGPLMAWILKGFTSVGKAITAPIRNLLREAGEAGMDGMRIGLRMVWDDIAAWFSRLPGWITDRFAGAGSWLWDAGVAIIRGLLGGIGAMARAAANAAVNVARGAVNAVKSFLGISSPSRLFMEIGSDTMTGLTLGVEAEEARLVRALKDMAGSMAVGWDRSPALLPAPAMSPAPTVGGSAQAGIDYDLLAEKLAKATARELAQLLAALLRAQGGQDDPMHVAREIAWRTGA